MNFRHVFFAFALLFTSPSYASTDLFSNTLNLSSPNDTITSSGSIFSYMPLVAGVYRLSLAISNSLNSYNSSKLALYEVDSLGNELPGVHALAVTYSAIAENHHYDFSLSDTAGKLYKIALTGSVRGGSMTTTGTFSLVQAVPGPIAGSGLGSLGIAGFGFWALRRRKTVAAV